MKRCPECRRDYYDDTLLYCLDDGSRLVDGPAGMDEPATAIISTPDSVHTAIDTDADTKVFTSGAFISRKIKRHKIGTTVIATVACVVLTGFAYGVYRLLQKTPPEKAPSASSNMQIQRLTGDGKTRDAEISPDGKFLVYLRTEGGEQSLWIKQIQTNSNITVVKPGEMDRIGGLAFSPDGNFVYFNGGPKTAEAPSVYRVPTLGGTPTKVLTNANSVQFSPDGNQVSFVRFDFATSETAIFVSNADGANERKIASRIGKQFFEETTAWSPDGKMIAGSAGDDSLAPNPEMKVVLISVSDGTQSDLGTTLWFALDDLVWHPSGDSLIIVASDVSAIQTQLWEVSYPAGNNRRLTNDLNGHGSVSITSDGKSIVTGELYSRSAVWVSPDLTPENAKPVMAATADTWGLSWTPDNRIVFASAQTGDSEIWIIDADGANAKPLTNDRNFKSAPVVSPDGRYIVYFSARGGGQLERIDITGGNLLVFNKSVGADNPDISPDGKWILYNAYIDGTSKIMRVLIGGGEPEILTDYRAIEPRYSHDGRSFACFVPNETTQIWTRVAIVPADGGQT